ncbi:hypothetical protein ACTFQF_00135 [Aliivibrio fischeri]|uniref:Uncharacterized protein n=1 Tax=Aliivibrio fischeri (strain MJ11) TaxID=388396 RepID=B5EW36_ALIFM|nr:hypothetical protein [Aliivibrio fischeri]ACH64816.1 hypothetical protein VFMJ11_B0093 [Aliivibrio fischeri MJ11]
MAFFLENDDTHKLLSRFTFMMLSMRIYKELAGKSLNIIMKNQFIELDNEHANVELEEFLKLEYIEERKRMLCACMFNNFIFMHDISSFSPEPSTFTDIELKEYCLKNGVAIFKIEQELLIVTSNFSLLNELKNTSIKQENNNNPIISFLRSTSYRRFHLAGAIKEHCVKAMTPQHLPITSIVNVEGVYQPLSPLLDELLENNSFSVQTEINFKTNEIFQLSIFKHEQLFTESICNKNPTLGLSIKMLTNLYYSLNEDSDNTILICFSGKYQELKCKISRYKTNHDNYIIMLSFIKTVDDKIAYPNFQYSLSHSIESLIEGSKERMKEGSSIVLCLPKKFCLQNISLALFIEALKLYKQGGFAYAINTDRFDYKGRSFNPINKSVFNDLDTLEHLIINAVIYGPLKNTTDIDNAVSLLKNLHNIIAVTHATKELLPEQLKHYAIQIK